MSKESVALPTKPSRTATTPRVNTRERLIAAATELMWKQGIGEVAVEAVLERAGGVLKGSFYHFFPSKADLLLECLERIWQDQSNTLSAVYDEASTPEAALERHVELIFEAQVKATESLGFVPGSFNMSMPTSLLREDTRIAGKLRELMESNRHHMERGLVQIARCRPLSHSVEETARLLSYAISGAILTARMENSLEPLDDLKLILGQVLGSPLKRKSRQ